MTSMSSRTFSGASSFSGFGLFRASERLLNGVKKLGRSFASNEITTAAELMALADYYESTQPSLAADLRAAATRDNKGDNE